MTRLSELGAPAETQRKIVCDRCGIARPGELRRLGIAVNGRITAERDLCLRCVDFALEAAGAALRRFVPGETLL